MENETEDKAHEQANSKVPKESTGTGLAGRGIDERRRNGRAYGSDELTRQAGEQKPSRSKVFDHM